MASEDDHIVFLVRWSDSFVCFARSGISVFVSRRGFSVHYRTRLTSKCLTTLPSGTVSFARRLTRSCCLGEWLRDKWHLSRGFVKAHVAVDTATAKVLAVRISDDRTHDHGFLIPLVKQAQRLGSIKRVLADAAYDTRENFDFLDSQGIESGIKIRKSANTRSLGRSWARPMAVRELHRLGFEAWSSKYEYSMRWKVEVVFSAVKRAMGEALLSKRSDLVLREAQHKFIA